jgi:hypothetical protein
MHEGANGGKACIASANAVVPAFLQVFEELQNQRRVQVLENDIGWSFAQPLFGEGEQQPETVSVSSNGAGASVPLLHEAFDEEVLQQ